MTNANGRDIVGITLAGSEETEAVVETIRATLPDATVIERAGYYKVERAGTLPIDLDLVSEVLGRTITREELLVVMASYYGRIVFENRVVELRAEIRTPSEGSEKVNAYA